MIKHSLIFVFIAFIVQACSMSPDALWPTLEEEERMALPKVVEVSPTQDENTDRVAVVTEQPTNNVIYEEADSVAVGPAQEEETVVIASSQTRRRAPAVSQQARTGAILTYVGRKAGEMREEYLQLVQDLNGQRGSFDEARAIGIGSAERYHATIAAVAARLQVGTTPGNPILLQQYEMAQDELASVGKQGQDLVDLGTRVASLSSRASYLLEATRSSRRLRGAVDEDHRQLARLEDDVRRAGIDITRLLEELNEAVRRQDVYLAAERRRLTQLSAAINTGESLGSGLGNIPSLAPTGETLEPRADSILGGAPIAVIRVIGESDEYEQSLYGAVSAALDSNPASSFTLVAVSPVTGNPSEKAERAALARDQANRVLRSLVSMGMPASRLSVTERAFSGVTTQEVHVFAN